MLISLCRKYSLTHVKHLRKARNERYAYVLSHQKVPWQTAKTLLKRRICFCRDMKKDGFFFFLYRFYTGYLIPSTLQTKTYRTFANSIELDEMARYGPSHQDPHCVPIGFGILNDSPIRNNGYVKNQRPKSLGLHCLSFTHFYLGVSRIKWAILFHFKVQLYLFVLFSKNKNKKTLRFSIALRK